MANKKWTAEDARNAQRIAQGLDPYDSRYDLDGDGSISSEDMRNIHRGWAGLAAEPSAAAVSPAGAALVPAAGTTANGGYKYTPYTPSQSVQDAQSQRDLDFAAWQAAASQPFSYAIEDIYNQMLDEVVNREGFSYDMNGDALYASYKNQYTKLGQQAMQDTVARAAAMTGGYGNSYASTAGQQAYQGYLGQLNDIVPELYNAAYSRYEQEGQDNIGKLNALQSDRNREYNEYMDSINAAQNKYTTSFSAADDAYNREYAAWKNDNSWAYQQEQDEYNRQQDAAAIERSNASSAQSTAQEQVYAMIEAGQTPPLELIATAGMDESTVKSLSSYYAQKNTPAAQKISSGSAKVASTPTAREIAADLLENIDDGMDAAALLQSVENDYGTELAEQVYALIYGADEKEEPAAVVLSEAAKKTLSNPTKKRNGTAKSAVM